MDNPASMFHPLVKGETTYMGVLYNQFLLTCITHAADTRGQWCASERASQGV